MIPSMMNLNFLEKKLTQLTHVKVWRNWLFNTTNYLIYLNFVPQTQPEINARKNTDQNLF